MKEIRIITPAENPRVKLINLGPGLFTAIPNGLPMLVESPAPLQEIMESTYESLILFTMPQIINSS
jgi:hypothetical protein